MIDPLRVYQYAVHSQEMLNYQCPTDEVNARDMDKGLLSSIIDIPLILNLPFLLPTC
jgi:hypothetical protein